MIRSFYTFHRWMLIRSVHFSSCLPNIHSYRDLLVTGSGLRPSTAWKKKSVENRRNLRKIIYRLWCRRRTRRDDHQSVAAAEDDHLKSEDGHRRTAGRSVCFCSVETKIRILSTINKIKYYSDIDRHHVLWVFFP